MKRLLLLLLLAPVSVFASDPIASDRLAYGGSWDGTVGVSNGIPSGSWSKSGSTINAYTGSAATINSAISSASDNTYVELGSGTFNLSSVITVGNSYTELRGQVDGNGVPTTTVNFTGGADKLIDIRSGSGWDISSSGGFTTRTVNSPSASALRGVSTVTLSSAPTGMSVGQVIFFTEDTDYGGDDFYGWLSSGNNTTFFHWTRCTAISGSDVSFYPPFNADFLTGTVEVHYKSGGGMVQQAGIRNLIVTGASTGANLTGFYGADECWMVNCNIGPTDGSGTQHIQIYCMFRCEVRHCEIGGQSAYGNSSYAIKAYAGGSFLVIDNYFYDLSNLMPTFGLSNSAIVYNYCNEFAYDTPNGWLSQIMFSHGGFDSYLLFEGNWVPASFSDADGSSRNIVWLRNRMRGYDADGATGETTSNTECMSQFGSQFYKVMAGNILGENGNHDTVYVATASEGYPAGTIYNLGNSTTNTFLRYGNYNTVDDGVNSEETLGGGEVIADSYLFGSKPSFAHYWPNITVANMTAFSGKADATNLLAAAYRSLNSGAEPDWAESGVTTTKALSGTITIQGTVK